MRKFLAAVMILAHLWPITATASQIAPTCAAVRRVTPPIATIGRPGARARSAAQRAAWLLGENPDPSEAEIREGISGNLCRCTGYDKIVRAVMDTAAEMRAQ